jgi:hypothetical protein
MFNSWKRWILLNPFRVVKYVLNNTSGDADISFAYDPGIFKYAKQAAVDLWKWHYKKKMSKELQAELDEALRDAVIGSGITVHDIPDVSKNPDLARLLKGVEGKTDLNLIARFWRGTKNFVTWRENVLRLAAYRRFKERLRNGEKLYGVSNPAQVDKAPTLERKAALMARELIGDYGGLSEGGQWLRRHMIPFYSWMEINAPRYIRLFRNLPLEGRGTAGPAGRLALGLAAKVGVKASFLSLKMMSLFVLVTLWNHLFFPDEEEEIGETGRRQLHLILPWRREDGSVASIRLQGALSDALSWFGAEDFPADMEDLASGKKSIYEYMGEAPYAAINKLIQAGRPDVKVGAEVISGKAFYPEFTKPRAIRDRLEHIANMFSLGPVYKRIMNKPIMGDTVMKRLWSDIQGIATYSSDTGEVSYHEIRKQANEWLDKKGIERGISEPTGKSNALFYYKQALRYGDDKAAEKYLRSYVEDFGGSLKGISQSIKLAHPMAGVPVKYRREFKQSLNEKDQDKLARASAWYSDTYDKSEIREDFRKHKRDWLLMKR